MKLIHVADVHLGAKLNFLGAHAPKQRENIGNAFSKAISKAIDDRVDIFLIAGDLFDSNDPANSTLIFAIREIKKLLDAQIYVALIPGNHDPLLANSVYSRPDWGSLFSNQYFHLFTTEEITTWKIPELDTVIYGAAVTQKRRSNSQLDSFKQETAGIQIGLFHGSTDLLGEAANYPLPIAKLKQLKLDYIALGDWHSTLEICKQSPCCWYAGSPEVIASDQTGSGRILEVDISEHKVEVKPVPLSNVSILNTQFDITSCQSNFEIINKVLLQLTSPESTILGLKLTGNCSLTYQLDIEEILSQLRNKCFYVNIDNNTSLSLSAEQIKGFSKHFIIANYIEYIKQFQQDNPKQGDLADQALQLGLSLLLEQQRQNEIR